MAIHSRTVLQTASLSALLMARGRGVMVVDRCIARQLAPIAQ